MNLLEGKITSIRHPYTVGIRHLITNRDWSTTEGVITEETTSSSPEGATTAAGVKALSRLKYITLPNEETYYWPGDKEKFLRVLLDSDYAGTIQEDRLVAKTAYRLDQLGPTSLSLKLKYSDLGSPHFNFSDYILHSSEGLVIKDPEKVEEAGLDIVEKEGYGPDWFMTRVFPRSQGEFILELEFVRDPLKKTSYRVGDRIVSLTKGIEGEITGVAPVTRGGSPHDIDLIIKWDRLIDDENIMSEAHPSEIKLVDDSEVKSSSEPNHIQFDVLKDGGFYGEPKSSSLTKEAGVMGTLQLIMDLISPFAWLFIKNAKLKTAFNLLREYLSEGKVLASLDFKVPSNGWIVQNRVNQLISNRSIETLELGEIVQICATLQEDLS